MLYFFQYCGLTSCWFHNSCASKFFLRLCYTWITFPESLQSPQNYLKQAKCGNSHPPTPLLWWKWRTSMCSSLHTWTPLVMMHGRNPGVPLWLLAIHWEENLGRWVKLCKQTLLSPALWLIYGRLLSSGLLQTCSMCKGGCFPNSTLH